MRERENHFQQIYPLKKGNSSRRKEMIPEENIEYPKGRKRFFWSVYKEFESCHFALATSRKLNELKNQQFFLDLSEK